jgi:hypothetical protein
MSVKCIKIETVKQCFHNGDVMNIPTETLQFVGPNIFELNVNSRFYYIATSGNNIPNYYMQYRFN